MRWGVAFGLVVVGCGGVAYGPEDAGSPEDANLPDTIQVSRRREAGATLPEGVDPALQDRINEGFCYCGDAGLLCGGKAADAGAVNDCWYCRVGCR